MPWTTISPKFHIVIPFRRPFTLTQHHAFK